MRALQPFARRAQRHARRIPAACGSGTHCARASDASRSVIACSGRPSGSGGSGGGAAWPYGSLASASVSRPYQAGSSAGAVMSTRRLSSAISTNTPSCSSARAAAKPVMRRADTSITMRVGSCAAAPASGAGSAVSPAMAPISARSAPQRRTWPAQSSRAAMNTAQSMDDMSR